MEIVGVVEDGKYETLTEAPEPAVFFPILQSYSPSFVLLARSRRAETELAAEMRQAIGTLDPDLPVYGAGGLRQMLGLVYLPMRAAVVTLGAFGVLAVMLSITGIYGLAAYTVSRRAREIGIRIAHRSQARAGVALCVRAHRRAGRRGSVAGAGAGVRRRRFLHFTGRRRGGARSGAPCHRRRPGRVAAA